jgi:hypothetical protein
MSHIRRDSEGISGLEVGMLQSSVFVAHAMFSPAWNDSEQKHFTVTAITIK